jgi:hypothetical protein
MPPEDPPLQPPCRQRPHAARARCCPQRRRWPGAHGHSCRRGWARCLRCHRRRRRCPRDAAPQAAAAAASSALWAWERLQCPAQLPWLPCAAQNLLQGRQARAGLCKAGLGRLIKAGVAPQHAHRSKVRQQRAATAPSCSVQVHLLQSGPARSHRQPQALTHLCSA